MKYQKAAYCAVDYFHVINFLCPMFATNGEVFENRPQVVTNLTLNLPIYLTSKQTEVIFNSVENLPALSWPYLLALTQVQI